MNLDRITVFQEQIWDFYHKQGRDLPWRHEPFDPYQILVSEMMLQQTQVSRVIPKYLDFLKRFPTSKVLAEASLAEVLRAWSGLGYNRRAKYLHEAAKQLTDKKVWKFEDLVACKGIGINTAAAIAAYAYNEPNIFIETNIRTVYIHHFFADKTGISDKELLPFIEKTIDLEQPREFYWALMDYGSHLKKVIGNVSRASKHYVKQSPFQGSKRQIRGQVIKILSKNQLTKKELTANIPDQRLEEILDDLIQERLIKQTDQLYTLA